LQGWFVWIEETENENPAGQRRHVSDQHQFTI